MLENEKKNHKLEFILINYAKKFHLNSIIKEKSINNAIINYI